MSLIEARFPSPETNRRTESRAARYVILLLASQLVVASCTRQKVVTYEAEYLLVDHLETVTAVKKSRRPLSAPNYAIDHDERRVLFQHPPAIHRFPEVPTGPNARFLAAPAMMPKAWKSRTDGVGFEVSCRAADGNWVQLLELLISPAQKPEDRVWHDREVALERCSQPTTEIELRTSCGPRKRCAADWAIWGTPKVMHEQILAPEFDRLALLISVDTLRPDRLALYGGKRENSTELERLAQDGIVFETTVASSPWTIPSHASILTSTDPRVHGANSRTSIAESVPLLAEILSEAGWQTAGFVDSPYVSRSFGFDRGFDHFDDDGAPKGDFRRGGRLTRQRLIDWLASGNQKPAFIFWHLMDVHGPYRAPAPFGGKFRSTLTSSETPDPRLEQLRGLGYHKYLKLERFSSFDDLVASYDEGIAATDSILGGLFQVLRDLGLYDDALIVVTSDHGESFLDHDVWVGHGLFLTDDEIRVPLIVKLPGNRHAGMRVREMVSSVDIAPSILDALGIEKPGSFQGQSLISPAPGEPESLRKVAYGFSDNIGVSFMRTESFKYITPATVEPEKILARTLKPRGERSLPLERLFGEQLYHLRQDSHEMTSLTDHADSGPQLEAYRSEIARHIAECEARRAGAPATEIPDLTPEAKRRLEALGYLN